MFVNSNILKAGEISVDALRQGEQKLFFTE